jgi:hypothetical protein
LPSPNCSTGPFAKLAPRLRLGHIAKHAATIGPWEPNSYHVDVWEEFSFVRNTCSSDCWTIRNLWNNRWVSAELGYGGASNGMLRARRVQCGLAHARGFG